MDRLTAAVAAEGSKECVYLGEIRHEQPAIKRMVLDLKKSRRHLRFYYEAGSCGYALYRYLTQLGVECVVVAPSLIPKKPGERIKNDKRDARKLARLGRAGELTAIAVPGIGQEAMRDLIRAREDAVRFSVTARQQLLSFLLRHGQRFSGKTNWTWAFYRWLEDIKFDTAEQRVVLQNCVDAVGFAKKRIEILEEQIRELLPDWPAKPIVDALMALRGFDVISAATIVAEVGDFRRFSSAPEFMSYVGLIPSEYSSGNSIKRGTITKCGNRRVRRLLIEGSWAARHAPYKTKHWKRKAQNASEAVCEIAFKAMRRLHKRYYRLAARRKEQCKVVTAIAREFAGFVWAVGIQAHAELEQCAA